MIGTVVWYLDVSLEWWLKRYPSLEKAARRVRMCQCWRSREVKWVPAVAGSFVGIQIGGCPCGKTKGHFLVASRDSKVSLAKQLAIHKRRQIVDSGIDGRVIELHAACASD